MHALDSRRTQSETQANTEMLALQKALENRALMIGHNLSTSPVESPEFRTL